MMLSIIIKKWVKPAYYHIGLDYGPVNTKLAIIRFEGSSRLEACHLIRSDHHFKTDFQEVLRSLDLPIHCLIGAVSLSQTRWRSLELPNKTSQRWVIDSVKSLFSTTISPAYYDWHISDHSQIVALAVNQDVIHRQFALLKQANLKAYAIDVRIAALCRLVDTQNEYIVIDANYTSTEITWIKEGLPVACHCIAHHSDLSQSDVQSYLSEINSAFLESNSSFHLYNIYGTGDNWPAWLSGLETINLHMTYQISSIVPPEKYRSNHITDVHSYNLAIGLALWQGSTYDDV